MATLSQDTYIASGAPLTGLGGGASQISTFSSIIVRDSTITQTVVSAYISTLILDAEEAFISSVSTLGIYLDGNLLTTATGPGAELLLNGIPIATTANISSLTEWSFDPAISTVNMNSNPIINSKGYIGIGTVSTTSINADSISTLNINSDNISAGSVKAGNISTLNINSDNISTGSVKAGNISTGNLACDTAFVSSLVCDDILTTTLTVQSTIHSISSISSVVVEADSLLVSSINNSVYPPTFSVPSDLELSTLTINPSGSIITPLITNGVGGAPLIVSNPGLSVSTLVDVSSINGTSWPLPSADVSQWATFPALSSIRNNGTSNIDIITDTGASLGGAYTTITSQNGTGGVIDIVSKSGYGDINGGLINIRADGGGTIFPVAGSYGRVDITANGGQPTPTTALGGLINITANTPVGPIVTASSAIKLSAAGVNSYAGAIPSVGSVAGYNFMYGTLGANVCAGLPSLLPNVPGTVYIYGTTGIELNANVYTTYIQPYQYGIFNPADLTIAGRSDNYGLGTYTALVNVSTVGSLNFCETKGPANITGVREITGIQLAIVNLSSINGAQYPPTFAIPSDLEVSTLTAGIYVSTPELFVSTINGQEYIPGAVSPDLLLSTLTMNPTGGISTNTIAMGSDGAFITGQGFGPGDVVIISPTTVLIANGPNPGALDVAALTSISSINGVEYIPGGVSPDLTLSTLTMNPAGGISTPNIAIGVGGNYISGDENLILLSLSGVLIGDGVGAGSLDVAALTSISSINGKEYIPLLSDLTVSTLTTGIYVSTPQLFVSSINGQEYIPGSVSPNLQLSTLTMNPTGGISTNLVAIGSSGNYISGGVKVDIISPGGVLIGDGVGPGALNVAAITSVSTINGVVYPPPVFVDSYQIYVAPNGNDTTGTGSQQKPFLTINKAALIRQTISTAIEVSIILSSGTYTESFTLGRNTYLVGVPTGEARQPCNVVGTITMNDTTGNMGVSYLEITGNIIASSGLTVAITGCNITTAVGTSITSTGATMFITESRIFNSTNATISASSNLGSLTIRDCIIQTTGGNSCILSTVACFIRQCYITSTNATSTVLPLIKIINFLSITSEISFCKLDYTSPTIDAVGDKCCIQFAGSNTVAISVFNNILRCEGAIRGAPSIQCIQFTGSSTIAMSYGNLQCVGAPNFIAPTINASPMFPALQSRYASFSSDQTQPMTTANTPQIITHNTTEINTGGFNLSAGSIQVLKAGNYEVGISIQFLRVVGASVTNVNFWFRVNGVDVPRSCSQISITGNDAEFLATVSIIPSLNAGDVIQVMFGGPDDTVEVYAEPVEATPMAKPAIPSIITNIKLLL